MTNKETLEEAAERIYQEDFNNPYLEEIRRKNIKDAMIKLAKWQQEQDKKMYSEEELPKNLESVLAKIIHQHSLGLSQWYEVVYYNNDIKKWCCYGGSKTFQDGERVVDWKYCKDLI
jgi:hypothetical protein